jgi:hypothetical protein
MDDVARFGRTGGAGELCGAGPGFGVTVCRTGAWAGAEAAPNAASPRNIARTVPRIVFNTRIVPQLETLGDGVA